jgi:hypothetical protein
MEGKILLNLRRIPPVQLFEFGCLYEHKVYTVHFAMYGRRVNGQGTKNARWRPLIARQGARMAQNMLRSGNSLMDCRRDEKLRENTTNTTQCTRTETTMVYRIYSLAHDTVQNSCK